MAEDVADDDLAVGFAGFFRHALGVGGGGGEGLFHEDVGAGVHGGAGVVGVAVGVGGDGDEVGLQAGERLVEVGGDLVEAELGREGGGWSG